MKYFLNLMLALAIILSSEIVYSENELPMSVISRNITAYNNFLKEKNKSVLEIDNLESDYSNRNIACMVIIMQALNKGGYPAKLLTVDAPNYGREIAMTKEGQTVIMHQDAWDTSFDDSVYKSSEIIPKGKFVKGLYVSESDKKMFKVRNLEDLRKFTSVSNPAWDIDWKTLEKIGLKQLHKVSKKEFMMNQVLFRGVDFTIQEFANTNDLSYQLDKGKLIPIPGIKIALDGSRHFMISKKHINGKKVFEALEKGLNLLRQEGIIDKFLTEAGFYREEVTDWKTIRVDQ